MLFLVLIDYAWLDGDPRRSRLESRLLACRCQALALAILVATSGRPALRLGLPRLPLATCFHRGTIPCPQRFFVRRLLRWSVWARGFCSFEHLRFVPGRTVFFGSVLGKYAVPAFACQGTMLAVIAFIYVLR